MPLLEHTGCYNHAEREAVARCPECGQHFCRECITEHDDRVICGGCLAKLARPAPPARRAWAGVGHAAALAAGVLAAWFYFFVFGTSLLDAPAAFHDGTLWKASLFDEEEE